MKAFHCNTLLPTTRPPLLLIGWMDARRQIAHENKNNYISRAVSIPLLTVLDYMVWYDVICSTSNESQTGLGQILVIPKRTVDIVFLEFDPGNSPPALLAYTCECRSVVGSTNDPFSGQFKSVSKVDVLSKHPSSLPGPQQHWHFPQDVCASYVLLLLLLLGYVFTQSSLWRNTFAKMEQAARPLTSPWLVLVLLVSTYSLARYSGGTGLGSIQWQYPKGGRCSCFLLHSSWMCLCMLPLSLHCSLSIRNSQTGMVKLVGDAMTDQSNCIVVERCKSSSS